MIGCVDEFLFEAYLNFSLSFLQKKIWTVQAVITFTVVL